MCIRDRANIPNYSEFYEARHYTSGKNTDFEIEYAGRKTVLTDKVLFQNKMCIRDRVTAIKKIYFIN